MIKPTLWPAFFYITRLFERLKSDRGGVTSLEWGVIAAIIVVALAASVTSLGGKLTSTFSKVTNAL